MFLSLQLQGELHLSSNTGIQCIMLGCIKNGVEGEGGCFLNYVNSNFSIKVACSCAYQLEAVPENICFTSIINIQILNSNF